ncbi:unnamed protein product [Thelazia callipaeda]|uniref:Secreted protein n=1 Tax=Thelazia callipaeda TaxID=103827 RepID=A0A0N5CZA1_THECL|nr:unnamed protein product [Thelazia callipaeda]
MLAVIASLSVIRLITIVRAAPSVQQQMAVKGFWISADLLNIEWEANCLSIAYCIEPELKMTKMSNRAFVSHWIEGSAEDMEIIIEVIGIDPKYRFQRSCDQTFATKAFAHEKTNSKTDIISGLGKMIVELTGRCFVASLAVQKYNKHCPWCENIEQTNISAIENNGSLLRSMHKNEFDAASNTNMNNVLGEFGMNERNGAIWISDNDMLPENNMNSSGYAFVGDV